MSDSTTRAPDLDAIRRRRAGCTETPWRQVFGQSSYPATWPTTEVRSEDGFVCDTYDTANGEGKGATEDEIRNAEFIAHAPEDIDALITENERLTRELAAARAILDGRETPPTDAEIAAHAATGGRWRCLVPEALHMSADAMHGHAARLHRETLVAAGWTRSLWWALDATGKPCPWPVVTP